MNKKLVIRIANLVAWIGLITFLGISMSFVASNQSKVLSEEIEIEVDRSKAIHNFIDKQDVIELLKEKDLYVKGKKITEVNINAIEEILAKQDQVKSAQVYKTIDGRLCISIEQRIPILRIFNILGESYYIDKEGFLMKISNKYTPRVVVATGFIPQKYNSHFQCNSSEAKTQGEKILNNLFTLAQEINRDSFIFAITEQLYVTNDTLFEIVPKISDWSIVLGTATDVAEKFLNLKTFMKYIPKPGGWDAYKKIDLQYKNQIVCTKNIIYEPENNISN